MTKNSAFASKIRACVLLSLGTCAPVFATSYVVETTIESVVGDGLCGLREAIRAAATDAARDTCPAGEASDDIFLPFGTYEFVAGDELVGGPGTLRIVGGPPATIIDLGGATTFLLIHGGASVSLENLTIENGYGADGESAVVSLESNLRIENVVLGGNVGFLNAGALTYFSESDTQLVVLRSWIVGNSGREGGGARVIVQGGATAEFRDTTFSSNSAEWTGGGLHLHVGDGSTGVCARCQFESNTAEGWAGGAEVAVGGTGVARLVDVRFELNDAGSLMASAGAGGLLEIDRMFLWLGGYPQSDGFFDADLRAHDGGRLVMTNALLARGEANGVDALATESGEILISHSTVTDFDLGGRLVAQSNGSIRVVNSIFALSITDLLITPAGVDLEENLISVDPIFEEGGSSDYDLAPGSPAIDACASEQAPIRVADLSHRPRAHGSAPDCGAYEVSPGIFADGFETGDDGSWGLLLPEN